MVRILVGQQVQENTPGQNSTFISDLVRTRSDFEEIYRLPSFFISLLICLPNNVSVLN